MAIKYGVNADKQLVDSPTALAEEGQSMGTVKCIFDQYTLTAALSQNDTIEMGCLIPAGARVISAMVHCDASLDASGGTVQFGWKASADAVVSADADGFIPSVAFAGGVLTVYSGSADTSAAPGILKKFASAVQPVLLVDHAGGWDQTSGTVSVCIQYIEG